MREPSDVTHGKTVVAFQQRLASSPHLYLRPARVATLLRRVRSSLSEPHDVSLTLEVDETVHIATDEQLLVSALCELARNALTRSTPGSQVVLRCRAEDAGVVLEVEDGCGGLPHDSTNALFGVLIDGEARGVCSAREAIEVIGGEIYVETRPGEGCTVAALFPAAPPQRPSSVPPSDSRAR